MGLVTRPAALQLRAPDKRKLTSTVAAVPKENSCLARKSGYASLSAFGTWRRHVIPNIRPYGTLIEMSLPLPRLKDCTAHWVAFDLEQPKKSTCYQIESESACEVESWTISTVRNDLHSNLFKVLAKKVLTLNCDINLQLVGIMDSSFE